MERLHKENRLPSDALKRVDVSINQLIAFYKNSTTEKTLPQEYLYLEKPVSGNLDQDALAAARYLFAMALRHDAQVPQQLGALLSRGAINAQGLERWLPGKISYQVGIFVKNRAYNPTWEGTLTETDAYVRRAELILRKGKE